MVGENPQITMRSQEQMEGFRTRGAEQRNEGLVRMGQSIQSGVGMAMDQYRQQRMMDQAILDKQMERALMERRMAEVTMKIGLEREMQDLRMRNMQLAEKRIQISEMEAQVAQSRADREDRQSAVQYGLVENEKGEQGYLSGGGWKKAGEGLVSAVRMREAKDKAELERIQSQTEYNRSRTNKNGGGESIFGGVGGAAPNQQQQMAQQQAVVRQAIDTAFDEQDQLRLNSSIKSTGIEMDFQTFKNAVMAYAGERAPQLKMSAAQFVTTVIVPMLKKDPRAAAGIIGWAQGIEPTDG